MGALAAALRRTLRLPLLVALLFGGLATVAVVFPRSLQSTRDRLIRGWARMLIAACGVRLRESVAPGARAAGELREGHMLLANHVSWIDIFVIDALAPAGFVAKAEIARWPLVGALVTGAGTMYIERGRRHAVHQANQRIADALRQGRRIAVFPEGTTSDGRRLLPFHGNLVEAALHAGAPVVPVGLRYLDPEGRPSDAASFVGDVTFVGSVWRMLGEPEIVAEVHWLPAIEPPAEGDDAAVADADAPARRRGNGRLRQAVIERSRLAISERLALPLEDTLPDVVRDLRAARR